MKSYLLQVNTRGLLPQFRRFAVQSEQSGQTAVALVGTGWTVLLGGFSKGIQQTPPGRFSELLMPGMRTPHAGDV